MPLSEREQRLLDQIEQTLRIDDPALASSLRSAHPLARTRMMLVLGICAIIAGAGLLIAGLRLRADVAGTILGVAGFCLVVAGTDCIVEVVGRSRRDRRGHSQPR